MVDKFNQILNQILQEKQQLTVFAILKMDDLTDKWSVILSAPWASPENYTEVFNYVKNILNQKLSAEEKASVARIAIYPKEDHAIESLLQFQAGTVIKEDTKVNGFMIHEGYILYSNPQS